jgi:hypothetical protein
MGLQEEAQTWVLEFDHRHPEFAEGLGMGPSAVAEIGTEQKGNRRYSWATPQSIKVSKNSNLNFVPTKSTGNP